MEKIQPKLDLIKSSLSYKMHIPLNVEKKIRILCREIHNTEWSGILFYKVNGSFEDNSLEIECVDIYQMDEGSSTYTEFDMSADVMNYMVEHPELISEGVYQGLIHSHNNMPTFFSGTDTSTLLSEGSDINHFVSLIVNNAGKYTAGITRRVSVKQNVSEEFTYPSWNDTTNTGTREFVASRTYVQWFNLEIDIDSIPKEDESEILDRIKEVRKIKASKPKFTQVPQIGTTSQSFIHNPVKDVTKKSDPISKVTEPQLFDDGDDDFFNVNYNAYHYSDELIISTVKQLITLSLVLPNDKSINIDEWVKNMETIFDKRFDSDLVLFESLAVNIVDFLVTNVDEEEASIYLNPREQVAVFANDVKEALSELPKNKYIDSLISICDDYIY